MSPTWDKLVGQPHVIDVLSTAAAAAHGDGDPAAMTHAWLITGPPGSGRAVAAHAFAAALVCPDRGCGTCRACRDVATGIHGDVTFARPTGVIMGVERTRDLVGRAAVLPTRSDWNVIVIEDADRLNEHADNALLKSLEEPPARAVWILCAPSADDLLPTIRSRCRVIRLRTPSPREVADYLHENEGVEEAVASYASRAAQGHIGRARALATDEGARAQHLAILRIPDRLTSVAACLAVASEVVADARARVDTLAGELDSADTTAVLRAFGDGAKGTRSARTRASAALRDLEKETRNRRRRMLRDELDRVLIDLTGLYRDALTVLCGADVALINAEAEPELGRISSALDAPGVLRRIDALTHARAALAADGSEELLLSHALLELHTAGQ